MSAKGATHTERSTGTRRTARFGRRGSRRPHEEVGDTVVFAKYSNTEIRLDGEGLLILDAEDCSG
jgi:co-chaperonin GroES (HSP10)